MQKLNKWSKSDYFLMDISCIGAAIIISVICGLFSLAGNHV